MPYERTIIKRGQALNVPDVRSDFCGGKILHKSSHGPLLLPVPYGIIAAFFEREWPAQKTQ